MRKDAQVTPTVVLEDIFCKEWCVTIGKGIERLQFAISIVYK